MNPSSSSAHRRDFLKSAGAMTLASPLLGAISGQVQAAGAATAGQDQPVAPPADLEQSTAKTGADIGSLFPLINRMARRDDFSYSFLGDRFQSLDEFKQASRAKVWECFGKPLQEVELNAEIIDRQDMGDYIREKILFSTTPEFRVPAYLHIPKAALAKPHPTVIDLHSHGGMFLFGKEKVIDLGNNHPVMTRYHNDVYGGRPTSTELVRRGYVVMTIDTFMFGERRLMLDEDLKYGWERSQYSEDDAKHLNAVCRSKEATLAKSLALAGHTWPGIVTWDDMRTVDYLLTRPEVDGDRIGCLGVSMGGHRTLYLAGLDERIAAACVVGFMSTVEPMIKSHIDTHSFVHFVPGLHQYLDMPDVVSLAAPKPLLVQQCVADQLYPEAGMRAAVAKIAAVYDKAGAKKQFTGQFFPGQHRFDQPMQNDAFAWLDEQLGNRR